MTQKEDEENDYKRKIREYIEADRERTSRRQQQDGVKLSRLKARMPLGCWIWVLVVGALAFTVLRWLLRTYPNIL